MRPYQDPINTTPNNTTDPATGSDRMVAGPPSSGLDVLYLDSVRAELQGLVVRRLGALSTTDNQQIEKAIRSLVAEGLTPNASTAIGVPGTYGFGVGVCPNPPDGFAPMDGTFAMGSPNYGNYLYSDGSVMVWIPAFYYRINHVDNLTHAAYAPNDVDIKPYSAYANVAAANSAGYALHRAFYNAGEVQTGFFIDKYKCSNNGGIASSIKNGKPLSTAADHNPIGALVNTPANLFAGCIDAAKSRGAQFHCQALYQNKALALLSLAHAQASASTAVCAWYDPNGVTNFPKGNNNAAYGDTNDSSIAYTPDGYTTVGATPALSGSGTPFAKTTHNGQACGVADLNGNLYEVCPFGLTSDGTNFYVLKTTADIAAMTSGTSGALDVWSPSALASLYTNIGAPFGALQNRVAAFAFGGSGQCFPSAVNAAVAGDGWQAAGLGIPSAGQDAGTNLFGNDYLYDSRPNQMCPLVALHWNGGSHAGVWALNCNLTRGSPRPSVGLRVALYP